MRYGMCDLTCVAYVAWRELGTRCGAWPTHTVDRYVMPVRNACHVVVAIDAVTMLFKAC